jgi:uncharacterized protein YjbI with pentapeptide repeats
MTQLSTIVYFTGVPSGGFPVLVPILERNGARTLGVEGNARVPIAALGQAIAFLDYATSAVVVGDTWTAYVHARPVHFIDVRWGEVQDLRAMLARAATLLAELAEVAAIDFAVTQTSHADFDRTDPAAVRDVVIARAAAFPQSGPDGLGQQTVLGQRLLDLMDADARKRLSAESVTRTLGHDALLVDFADAGVGDGWMAERTRIEEQLVQSGIGAIVRDGKYDSDSQPGSRWRAPQETWPRAQPAPASAEADIEALQNSSGDPVQEIAIDGLVAPFIALDDMQAEELELEGAVLAFASMAGAQITDAGLVGADLRGINAPSSRWFDVSLVDADLRWAYLEQAELPDTRLDNADCSHAILIDASKLESAQNARFDHVHGEGWAPGARSSLAGATFRAASLAGANFDDVDLKGAVFEDADLGGASFQRANLTDARFTSCVLDGADFQGANLTNVVFDPPRSE